MQALRGWRPGLPSWALIGQTVCGERIIAEGKSTLSAWRDRRRSSSKSVRSGKARPGRRVRRRTSATCLAERFRVFDVETGALVLEAQGRAPNLSPTGRFLAAYQGGRDSRMLDLFDLESGARESVAQQWLCPSSSSFQFVLFRYQLWLRSRSNRSSMRLSRPPW